MTLDSILFAILTGVFAVLFIFKSLRQPWIGLRELFFQTIESKMKSTEWARLSSLQCRDYLPLQPVASHWNGHSDKNGLQSPRHLSLTARLHSKGKRFLTNYIVSWQSNSTKTLELISIQCQILCFIRQSFVLHSGFSHMWDQFWHGSQTGWGFKVPSHRQPSPSIQSRTVFRSHKPLAKRCWSVWLGHIWPKLP